MGVCLKRYYLYSSLLHQQELQKKYADELRKYEKDLSSAQKEKDELLQQAKNAKHDPTNKIAEQRRKRIQVSVESIQGFESLNLISQPYSCRSWSRASAT